METDIIIDCRAVWVRADGDRHNCRLGSAGSGLMETDIIIYCRVSWVRSDGDRHIIDCSVSWVRSDGDRHLDMSHESQLGQSVHENCVHVVLHWC